MSNHTSLGWRCKPVELSGGSTRLLGQPIGLDVRSESSSIFFYYDAAAACLVDRGVKWSFRLGKNEEKGFVSCTSSKSLFVVLPVIIFETSPIPFGSASPRHYMGAATRFNRIRSCQTQAFVKNIPSRTFPSFPLFFF